jgi:hypothetical protein
LVKLKEKRRKGKTHADCRNRSEMLKERVEKTEQKVDKKASSIYDSTYA